MNRLQPNEIGSASNLRPYVGQRGSLRIDGKGDNGDLHVAVTVVDARKVFDLVHLRVTPVAGSGSQWVGLSRISNLHHPESEEVGND